MKKVITYILVLVVSCAYSYESIEYFSKVYGNITIASMDAESEESNEKNEKESFSDDFFLHNKHLHNRVIANLMELASLGTNQNKNFSPSDYSHEVYSPPEFMD